MSSDRNTTTTRDGEVVQVICRIPGRATLVKSAEGGTRWVKPAFARMTPAEREQVMDGGDAHH
ncbi:hypothetical protein [Ferrovibrio terrae]|uniref:hypothetical protein n=1 Tax=Ferrovibrio terrae TaxID=2594003 RepID=UPI0031379AE8